MLFVNIYIEEEMNIYHALWEIYHSRNSAKWNTARLNFCCVLIICVFARATRIFLKALSRSSKREWVHGVDRAIHSMELDSRVDAFFARPSRDRLNFEQIEKAADPIISASRFRCLTAERSSMTDLDKRTRTLCILDKNLRVRAGYYRWAHYRSSYMYDSFQHSGYRGRFSQCVCVL